MLRTTLMVAVFATALAACKWTEFDDLSDTTWVHSTQKPAVNSTDYGIEILQVQKTGDGGQLAVIGANEPSISTLVYDTAGNTTLGSAAEDLNKEYTINSIPSVPALVSDPASDDIALVIPSTEGRTVVLSGAADALVELTINDPKPNSAVYIPTATAGSASTLLVSGTGDFHGVTGNTASTCSANDETINPLNAVTMAVDGGNVLVWEASGVLTEFAIAGTGSGSDATAAITGTCDGITIPAVVPNAGFKIDTKFAPGPGSMLVPLSDTLVLVAGISATIGGDGMAGIYDLSTQMPAGTPPVPPATYPGLASVTYGTMAGTNYVMLGFPSREVEDTSDAGQVEVHEVDTTNGVISDTIALALNDDQPETNQSFGQAVSIMHFNDDSIFVIAANNEIFSYYETNLVPGDARK